MNRKIVSGLLLVAAVAFAAAGYLCLPDQVVVQVGFDGKASNIMPKMIAILIPFAISAVGAAQLWLSSAEEETKPGKFILLSVVGCIVSAVMLIVNM